MIRRLIDTVLALVAMMVALVLVLWVQAALGQTNPYPDPIPCSISGDLIPGTKLPFPERNDGSFVIEIDRDGRTLDSTGFATGYAFARDGEPWRQLVDGVVVGSGVGQGSGCEDETTTTTIPEPTTTTLPQACDEVECPPQDTTTTTQPEVTTTTQFVPNQPGANGNDSDGFAASEGG